MNPTLRYGQPIEQSQARLPRLQLGWNRRTTVKARKTWARGRTGHGERLKPENPVITGEPVMFVMRLILAVFIRLVAQRSQRWRRRVGAFPVSSPVKEFCPAGELLPAAVFLLPESNTFSPPKNIRQPSGVRVNRRPIFYRCWWVRKGVMLEALLSVILPGPAQSSIRITACRGMKEQVTSQTGSAAFPGWVHHHPGALTKHKRSLR